MNFSRDIIKVTWRKKRDILLRYATSGSYNSFILHEAAA